MLFAHTALHLRPKHIGSPAPEAVWSAASGTPPAAWFDVTVGARLRPLLAALQRDVAAAHKAALGRINKAHARLLAVSAVDSYIAAALIIPGLANANLHITNRTKMWTVQGLGAAKEVDVARVAAQVHAHITFSGT